MRHAAPIGRRTLYQDVIFYPSSRWYQGRALPPRESTAPVPCPPRHPKTGAISIFQSWRFDVRARHVQASTMSSTHAIRRGSDWSRAPGNLQHFITTGKLSVWAALATGRSGGHAIGVDATPVIGLPVRPRLIRHRRTPGRSTLDGCRASGVGAGEWPVRVHWGISSLLSLRVGSAAQNGGAGDRCDDKFHARFSAVRGSCPGR
jgi:hypothetical protein